MLPKVIIFNSVSIDGRINGFEENLLIYNSIASQWDVDAVLMGSNTILSDFNIKKGGDRDAKDHEVPKRMDNVKKPLLVVPDSSGKIRIWDEIRETLPINNVLVLCSRSTPREYLDFLDNHMVQYMVVGFDKVNLGTALEELNTQFGIKSLRVDGGGTLNSALLFDDLVDEVCVLIYPALVGGLSSITIDTPTDLTLKDEVVDLKLLKMEKLKNEIILLHYRVMKYQF